jgi:lactate permease
LYGAANGLLPIGWIVLNIIFLHRLTTENGSFKVLQDSLARITDDRRLQLLLIAFCFGAFFEGAAGFGTPVAVTGAILIGLGFSPLAASGLALIANTAPVAFGALGTPIITLAKVTGLDEMELSMMVGRQLPFFSVIVPFWLIWAFAGWRKMLEIWPAILVAGVSFAVPQFLVSNYHGPMLVDVIAALISMACLTGFLKVWKPATVHTSAALTGRVDNSKIDAEYAVQNRSHRRLFQRYQQGCGNARVDAVDHSHRLRVRLGHPGLQEHVRHPSGDRSGHPFGQARPSGQTDARGEPGVRPGQ